MKQWKLEANHIVSSEFTSQTLICNQKSEISIWAWYSSLISFITLEGFRRKIWHIRSGFHQFLCDTATWRPSSTRLRLFCDALNTLEGRRSHARGTLMNDVCETPGAFGSTGLICKSFVCESLIQKPTAWKCQTQITSISLANTLPNPQQIWRQTQESPLKQSWRFIFVRAITWFFIWEQKKLTK